MKRISILFFTLFYLVSATGIPVTLHYCHDRVESMRIFSSHAPCDCSHSMKPADCCRDVHFVLKAETGHPYASPPLILTFYSDLFMLEENLAFAMQAEPEDMPAKQIPDLPPPKPVPIWLSNCALTYYS